MRQRRTLLTLHQAFGFAALVLLATTVVLGHLDYADQFTSGDFTGRYNSAHEGLAITTSALFATTGALALAAPNPYPKPIRLDAAFAHKALMALATAGMVTQLILGPITYARVGRLDQPDLALGHVVVGYATLGFMAGGVLAFTFH